MLLYIVLAYLMLYIVLAYLMRLAALSNAVCLHNASFLPMISANEKWKKMKMRDF